MEKRVDLVFQGGGVKGIGLAGAMLELDDRGFQPQCVAGTSAGAIAAAIVAAGYRDQELHDLINTMDFSKFADRPRHNWAWLAGEAWDVAMNKGLHSGDYFHDWITKALAAKGTETFAAFNDPKAEHEDRRYRLQVIAADLTHESMLVLPRDAVKLGIEPDELRVADAVRMSMSIPLFFEPWKHTNPMTGHTHLIVDGGLLSNFPVWLFDTAVGEEPRFPTFGLLLDARTDTDPLVVDPSPATEAHPGRSLPDYIKSLIGTALDGRDRFYVEGQTAVRTISIPTLGVGVTDFGISRVRAEALLQSGRDAASRFLASWDFAEYVARYRS